VTLDELKRDWKEYGIISFPLTSYHWDIPVNLGGSFKLLGEHPLGGLIFGLEDRPIFRCKPDENNRLWIFYSTQDGSNGLWVDSGVFIKLKTTQ
jgi:hypothetical protein